MGAPFFAGKPGKGGNQDLRAAAAPSPGLDSAVQFFRKFRARQDKAHLAAFLKAKAEILDKVIDEKTRRIIQFHHSKAKRGHGNAASRARTDKVAPFCDIKTFFLREKQG